MADSSRNRASIPPWQKERDTDSHKLAATTPSTDLTPSQLLEQAREFLTDESIKNASRDRKVEFLEKKGLQPQQIEQLFSETPIEPGKTEEQPEGEDGTLRTVHDSNLPIHNSKSSSAVPSPVAPPIPADDPPQAPPPIITYPEFLLKPQKPPPLVTLPRLINAIYAVAGLSLAIYGTSKYIIDPMLENLSTARHALAENALEDLEKLNTKLEASVSHIPYIATGTALKKHTEYEDDLESVDSDPTELFHRDVATQTSPPRSRSPSTSSARRQGQVDATSAQASKIASLRAQLSSLVHSTNAATSKDDYLKEAVADFQIVLDKLDSSYSALRNDYSSIYSSAASDSKKQSGKDSEAVRFRSEIRSLKGAFLSSRNFPIAKSTGATNYFQK